MKIQTSIHSEHRIILVGLLMAIVSSLLTGFSVLQSHPAVARSNSAATSEKPPAEGTGSRADGADEAAGPADDGSDYQDLPAPTGPFVTDPPGGTVDGVLYEHILSDGDYTLSGPLQGSVLVTGNAVLYIPKTGRIRLSASETIKVAEGASLDLYNDSNADAVFSGGFSNESRDATRFAYVGLPGTAGSKVVFTVAGELFGAIYAPRQDVVMTSPGSANTDFHGAVVGKNISVVQTTP